MMAGHRNARRSRAGLMAVVFVAGLLSAGSAAAAPVDVPEPAPGDRCPVCGMFVAKYPEWVATVVFRDGHAHHFDGAKDMFKFLFALPRYAPGHGRDDIAAMAVTDYYQVAHIDPREAWFVIGSDVHGPMGREMVPLGSAEDAAAFSHDHHGARTVRFDEVTPELIERMESGADLAAP